MNQAEAALAGEIALTEDRPGGAPPPTRTPPRLNAERRFYTGMALLFVAVVLIGFGPTFYLKPFGMPQYPRPAPELTMGLMIHGFTFGLWVMLFLAQSLLVAANRRDLHRALGIASFVFAIALVPIMYLNSVWQVARASAPPFTDPLTWTVVPLAAIPFYIAMAWMGWRARRIDMQGHKRLMLGLMIMLMQPAVGRFPIMPPTLPGFAVLCVLGWLLFVPLILWDRKRLGRLHLATKLGAGLYAALIAVQIAFLAFTGPWAAFATTLPGVETTPAAAAP